MSGITINTVRVCVTADIPYIQYEQEMFTQQYVPLYVTFDQSS